MLNEYSWNDSVLSVQCTNTVNCSTETIIWNSLDGEHLTFVHSGYKSARVMFEDGRNSLAIVKTRLPLFRFIALPTVLYVCVVNARLQISYASQLGVLSRTKIELLETESDHTIVQTTYEFQLPVPLSWFRSILARMIKKWNERVWSEDLPVKLRREWALKNGFHDFRGFEYGVRESELFLPMRRPADSPLHESPLRLATSRREKVKELTDTLNHTVSSNSE